MKPNTKWNDRDLELLSAYVDNELSENEKLEIEQKLKLSPDLQQELTRLQKLKNLTLLSAKKLPESPYFEARLMAALNTEKNSGSKLKKWTPAIAIGLLTVFLMVFLKYNPEAINEMVKKQQSNLTALYTQNLKPLLFAADLSNEDIFNFAFYHQLPLDKNDNKVLQLSYSDTGSQFFEIKNAGIPSEEGNYDKFIYALKLNDKEKLKMDSILESYKNELSAQILVNDKNTLAINPNLWNYNKAIVADLISFAKNTNRSELSKIIPGELPLYNPVNVRQIVSEVKSALPNEYIFITPDTIFSDEYVLDKQKLKEDVEKMKEEFHKDNSVWKNNLAIKMNIERNLAKLRKDSRWNKEFKIDFDSNFCRVNIAKIEIPQIQFPDMDEMASNIEDIVRHVQAFTVNFPRTPRDKNDMDIRIDSNSKGYNFNFRMPDLDSLTHFVPYQVDSMIRHNNRNFNYKNFNLNLDSMVSNFRFNYSDSMNYYQNQEFKKQMNEFQKEMKRFKEEMDYMKKNLRRDSLKSKTTRSIEI